MACLCVAAAVVCFVRRRYSVDDGGASINGGRLTSTDGYVNANPAFVNANSALSNSARVFNSARDVLTGSSGSSNEQWAMTGTTGMQQQRYSPASALPVPQSAGSYCAEQWIDQAQLDAEARQRHMPAIASPHATPVQPYVTSDQWIVSVSPNSNPAVVPSDYKDLNI